MTTFDGHALTVRFLGCGDPLGSGGRMQTSFMVSHSGGHLLLDCGASTMIAMAQQGVPPGDIDLVVLTHLHGDHFGGIPFLLLHAQYGIRRTRPLKIVGPPGTRDRLEMLMEASFPRSWATQWRFDLSIQEIEVGPRQEVEGIGISGLEGSHPSGGPSLALRLEVDGRVICYTGDTAWVPAIAQISRGADLLIAECYRVDRGVPYHMNHADLVEHRGELDAKRIILTHLGENALGRQDELEWEVADDGLVVEV